MRTHISPQWHLKADISPAFRRSVTIALDLFSRIGAPATALCLFSVVTFVLLQFPSGAYGQSVSFAGNTRAFANGVVASQVAVDEHGNVYIAPGLHGGVLVVSPSGVQTTVGSSFAQVSGVAVDASGNVFIADIAGNQVVEITPAGVQTTLFSGLNGPGQVAANGAGEVLVADYGNNRIVGHSASGTFYLTGYTGPQGLAIDSLGNTYVSEPSQSQILKINNQGAATVVGNNLKYPDGLAVDNTGNLFVADSQAGNIVEIAANGTQTNVVTGIVLPFGVAVDSDENVFYVDGGDFQATEVSQAVDFGNQPVCAPGQASPCGTALTLQYNINTGGALGAVQVLTQGTPSLDFTLGNSTCTGSFTQGQSCSLSVNFSPQAPGLRLGAVQVSDSSGNVLASTYVRGNGQSPAVAFSPVSFTTVNGNLQYGAQGVTVDASGNAYVGNSNQLVKITPDGHASAIVSGLNAPSGVAIDGAGNLYISDTYNNRILKVTPKGTQSNLGAGLYWPTGVAVDGQGNVFIGDTYNARVLELTPNGNQLTLGSGFSEPANLALDAAGNLYVADGRSNRVVKLGVDGTQTSVGTGLSSPYGVAVDAGGNVFIADTGNGRLIQVTPDGTQSTLSTQAFDPYSVAVNSVGDLYVVGDYTLFKVTRSQPTVLAFPITQVGATSSPLSVTIENAGNQNLNGTYAGSWYDYFQVPGSGTPTDCTTTFSIAPGGDCNLSIAYAPHQAGGSTSVAYLVDNALNAQAAAQFLELTVREPLASLSPASLSFGSVQVGSLSVSQTVTLSNTGYGPLAITSITVGPDFLSSGSYTCPSLLAPRSSCQIAIAFLPGSATPVNEYLTVADNSGATPVIQQVALSGVGIPIPPVTAMVSLGNLTQSYDGSPEPVTVVTSPSGLAVAISYTGINSTTYGPSGTAPTAPGTYSVLATVTDPNYMGSQGGTLTINQLDPVLGLALASGESSTAPYGTTVYFALSTATTPQCMTGTVQLYIDGVASGEPVTLNGSSCAQPVQLSTSTLSAGQHNLYVLYSGDTYFKPNNSATLAYTASQDTTTVTLGTSTSSVNVGQPVTLVATVAPGSPDNALPPAGTVIFYDGATQIGQGSSLAASSPGQPYASTFTTSSLAAGQNNITAQFVDSDGNFAGSSSAITVETVNLIVPTIHWTPSPTDFPYGTQLGSAQLNAAALDSTNNPISGTFSYNFSSGAVLPVGTINLIATFTPSDPSTYAGNSANVALTVDPSILSVTAANLTRMYGAANPSFTYQIAGLVNNDPSSVVTGEASCSTTAINTSPVGTYPITCIQNTLAAANYTFQFFSGTLTVTAATTTVSAFPTSSPITYGQALASSILTGGTASTPGIFAFTLPTTQPPLGTSAQSVMFTPTNTTDYTSVTGTVLVTVNPASQTITFPTPAGQVYGSTLALLATASSGLPVKYTSLTTAVCTVSGNAASMVGIGICQVQATQTGNSMYSAAATVNDSFRVNAAAQTITFAAVPTETVGAVITLSATASSGLPVLLSASPSTVCILNGTTLTAVGAGPCAVSALQAGNIDYKPASPVLRDFQVNLKPQSITFTTTSPQTAGAMVTFAPTATSGLLVTLTSNSPTICTVLGDTATLLLPGKCSITATQPGNTEYKPAAAVTRTFSVDQLLQTITFTTIPTGYVGSTITLGATSSSSLPVTYTTASASTVCTLAQNTVTLTGAGTCSITASQAGNTEFKAATSVTHSFAVDRRTQTITFPAPPSQVVGTSYQLAATASSGLPVTFTSESTRVCTVSSTGLATTVAKGTCQVKAAEPGNSQYKAASDVSISFAVTGP